ncbi:hypothetical protein A7K94_0206985 [Modestobacter sp. VKM Ac-2676]|nr:hypothetical protein A7K94_0206985 [Modestobacter sp. VKM Ac-2676]
MVPAVAAVAALALVATDVGFVLSRPLPWVQAPISTNWATAEQYQRIGEEMQEAARGEVVASPGEIGTLAYYCECDIVDVFSDRGAIVPLVARREREASPVMRALLGLNFTRLDRDQEPAEPTLGVAYVTGPGPADGWPVTSAWRGPGTFYLERLDGENTP